MKSEFGKKYNIEDGTYTVLVEEIMGNRARISYQLQRNDVHESVSIEIDVEDLEKIASQGKEYFRSETSYKPVQQPSRLQENNFFRIIINMVRGDVHSELLKRNFNRRIKHAQRN
jgi:hypothetical protein